MLAERAVTYVIELRKGGDSYQFTTVHDLTHPLFDRVVRYHRQELSENCSLAGEKPVEPSKGFSAILACLFR